jgi:hypothetical protein
MHPHGEIAKLRPQYGGIDHTVIQCEEGCGERHVILGKTTKQHQCFWSGTLDEKLPSARLRQCVVLCLVFEFYPPRVAKQAFCQIHVGSVISTSTLYRAPAAYVPNWLRGHCMAGTRLRFQFQKAATESRHMGIIRDGADDRPAYTRWRFLFCE